MILDRIAAVAKFFQSGRSAGGLCVELFLRAGAVDALANVRFWNRGIPGRPDFPEKTGQMEAFPPVALYLRGSVSADDLRISAGYSVRVHGNGQYQ